MRHSLLVFLTIAILLIPSQVMAFGEEDIFNILNGASTLSGTGRDWTGVGAAFAPPVLVGQSGTPTVGSYHELNIGEQAEVHLFLGDPENRARWIEWEITNLSGEIVNSGEIDCRDCTMALIPIQFDEPGLYYLAFYLTSKVRGQARFIITWNEAIQRTTDTSQMLIMVSGDSELPNINPNTAPENINGIYLLSSGVNFGSVPIYYTSGISNFQIHSNNPLNWVVIGPNGTMTFQNEHFLNLNTDEPGCWYFQTGNDNMTIVVLAGSSTVHAIADSGINVDTSENGNIYIELSAHAEAYAESNPVFVIGVGAAEIEEIPETTTSWSNYYPTNPMMYRVGLPENQIIHWYWDESTCMFQQDPTCGLPPDDWGWEPPVPPPPSGEWEPEIPPIP